MLAEYAKALGTAEFSESYHLIQVRRGVLFADLARWSEALPLLEQEDKFEHDRPVIGFYLGTCYAALGEYGKSKEKLVQTLAIGLPPNLEFRAHCTLGKTYHRLGEYAQAKLELVKCAETGDSAYIKEAEVWKWLESTCAHLGLKDEAKYYATLVKPLQ